MTRLCTGFLCFPFSNFRYSLTLFSKFFASFPHGTCLLLVSRIYIQLWMEFTIIFELQSQATRLIKEVLNGTTVRIKQECHPLCCPVPRDLILGCYPNQYILIEQFQTFYSKEYMQIFKVRFSCFSRPYQRNPCQFLFLRLIICLNSAGNLT